MFFIYIILNYTVILDRRLNISLISSNDDSKAINMQKSSEHKKNKTSYLANITQHVVICSSKRRSSEILNENSIRKDGTNRKITNSQVHKTSRSCASAKRSKSDSPVQNCRITINAGSKRQRLSSLSKLSLPEVLFSIDTDSQKSTDSDEKTGHQSLNCKDELDHSPDERSPLSNIVINGGVPPDVLICPGFSDIPPNLLIFEDDDIYSDTSNTENE